MTDRDADTAEIVRLHTEWMESNNDLDIARMTPNFADPGYHQFNLNGFTYDLPEKVRLWEGLHEYDIWHFHCSLAAGPGTFKYPQEMP